MDVTAPVTALPTFELDEIDITGPTAGPPGGSGDDDAALMASRGGRRGRVSRALWRRTGAVVALKEVHLPPEDAGGPAEAAARIASVEALWAPCNAARWPVVRYLAARSDSPRHYQWLLEWTDAVPLQAAMEGAPAAEPWAAAVARGALAGLQVLHDRAGLVHCDVSPANILVSGCGAAVRAVLGDLESLETVGAAPLSFRGSPLYAPPEVLLDCRTPAAPDRDVWALGVVAFQLLSGAGPHSHPFRAADRGPAADGRGWSFFDMLADLGAARRECEEHRSGRLRERVVAGASLASSAAVDFLCACLAFEPSRRASAAALMDSAWLRDS